MTSAKLPSLQSPEIDSVWALRLLCEAWLLTNWPSPEAVHLKNILQLEGDKPRLPKGIVLIPPVTLDAWLAPFSANDGRDPLDLILSQLTANESKKVVRDFFQKLKDRPAESNDVTKLFMELDAIVKAST